MTRFEFASHRARFTAAWLAQIMTMLLLFILSFLAVRNWLIGKPGFAVGWQVVLLGTAACPVVFYVVGYVLEFCGALREYDPSMADKDSDPFVP